ncbi:MAG: hypothetical protein EP338_04715 [Bacteroidetes bacterium]|nr:MAG: hypothetical protein EP338_04715 [Bacteroidota bacterium]
MVLVEKFSYLFFFVLSFQAQAQDVENEVLSRLHFDSVQLMKNGYHSVHVYQDHLNDHSPEGNFVLSRKRIEADYNDLGGLSYKRSSNLVAMSDILGGRSTQYVSYEYDKKGRIKKSCSGDYRDSWCQHRSYDEEGRVIEVFNDGDYVINSRIRFEWKNGKMIRAINTDSEGKETFDDRSFDEKGRVAEVRHNRGRFTFDYVDGKKYSTIIYTQYRDGKLNKRRVVKKLKTSDAITFACELNAELDTLKKIEATYDDHLNLVSFKSSNYKELIEAKKSPPPVTIEGERGGSHRVEQSELKPRIILYEVKNFYSEQGLLTKRVLSGKGEDGQLDPERQYVERIIFEKEYLSEKWWPTNERERERRNAPKEVKPGSKIPIEEPVEKGN